MLVSMELLQQQINEGYVMLSDVTMLSVLGWVYLMIGKNYMTNG